MNGPAFGLLLLLSRGALGQVPYQRIVNAGSEPGSWLTYSGGYQGLRYSPLDQINRGNASGLKPEWVYQMRTTHKVETSPLVIDGVMYITEPPSDVTALDLKTGRPIWSYRRTLPDRIVVCCGQVNRGVAALDDQLFLATVDAHVVALDARTGRVRWDIQVADYKSAYSLTLAPLAVKDKVIVGIAGAEYGIRGFLDAYDARTGKRVWRFQTVPGPGEPGNETWSGDSWKTGGAPTWMTGAYDPGLNLLYWGTGNPAPDYVGDSRLGDNLYSDCMLALDADTGKLKWHFQFVPHDVNDIDATQVPQLVDGEFHGVPRKLLLLANRNGFYYVLDRVTGEFLLGQEFARQNIAKGLDGRGRPIQNPATTPDLKGAVVYPDDDGAANWYSSSYSPQTKLYYVNAREKGGIYFRTDTEYQPGKVFLGASRRPVPLEEPWGALRALDAMTGKLRWEFKHFSPPWSGVMSTGGGLVFSGTMEGDFLALDASSGKMLWHFQTGGPVWASPISYTSEGKQYVTVAAGSSIFTFGL
jgi:alcohol dehydrogenase (cytochrome c)